jgi:hypothetical protein
MFSNATGSQSDSMLDLPTSVAFSRDVFIVEPPGRHGTTTTTSDVDEPIVRRYCRRASASDQTARTPGGAASEVEDLIIKEAVRLWKLQLLHRSQRLLHQEIRDRVRELQIDALLSKDNFNAASISDFHFFIDPLPLASRPAIFLLENGNLRALWKNDAKEQVGLQFLGAGAVQFVMFAQRQNLPIIMRDFGIDALPAMRERIRSNGCDRLLFG